MLSQENYLRATRQAGELIIREFSARMGSDYERQRNFDFGPANTIMSLGSPLIFEED